MTRFEKEAAFDRVLGPAFDGTAEFPMWIRPPKATALRALPPEAEGVLTALFQGNEGTSPLIELAVIGSAGPESLSEFQQKAFADLNKAGKVPGIELKRQDPATVPCMHGGETAFEVFSGGAARQTAASGPPTNYQWVCYFSEDANQKVLLTFIVPDAVYSAFADPMTRCLESLALGSKVAAARTGGTVGGTPSTGGASSAGQAPGTGASNF
jgi:hypothetical protein